MSANAKVVMFLMIVSKVSTILEFKGLCELGICHPRCIPYVVRPFKVNVFIG